MDSTILICVKPVPNAAACITLQIVCITAPLLATFGVIFNEDPTCAHSCNLASYLKTNKCGRLCNLRHVINPERSRAVCKRLKKIKNAK